MIAYFYLLDRVNRCKYFVRTNSFAPLQHVNYATVVSLSDCCISWVSELRYLGVNIVNSTSLKFSFERAKQNFYRAANSIFRKIGKIESEEVVIELFKCKCFPILLYCTNSSLQID